MVKSKRVLDLHGLSVKEALGKVFLYLTKTNKKQVIIVTGRGNGSPNGKPKIKPAVIKLLARHGYRFEVLEGALRVNL